ncbi:MAG TPA: metalloregulator ArsR/SmtB family transcription factor [Pelovirga sp.]|nr:metalloregulator ArsR/SmtB family transcription factor [Pelovirga sp.]
MGTTTIISQAAAAGSKTQQQQLIPLEMMEFAAECLRTLAHPHRLRIVEILLDHEESVGELARACDLPSHMVSDHLRILKDRGFLDNQRQGRKVFYRIAEPALADIMNCVQKRFGAQGQCPAAEEIKREVL